VRRLRSPGLQPSPCDEAIAFQGSEVKANGRAGQAELTGQLIECPRPSTKRPDDTATRWVALGFSRRHN
jgi:hypothetical protein